MRGLSFIGLTLSLLAYPVLAAAPPANPAQANPPQPCVDVQIGSDRTPYFNCLNDVLQRQVEHERNAPAVTAPIDAKSSSTQVGTFNEAAARQRMGNAFGVSSVPQRPSQTFVSPIVPPTAR
jgi:hypothetical protein